MVIDSCQEPNAVLFRAKQSKKIDKPEDRDTMLLRNISNILPVSAVQYPQKTVEFSSLLAEP